MARDWAHTFFLIGMTLCVFPHGTIQAGNLDVVWVGKV